MSLRKEIESLVTSANSPLGVPYIDEDGTPHPPKVHEMDIIILLRNLHPSLRAEYARRLYSIEAITEEQMKEFTTNQR